MAMRMMIGSIAISWISIAMLVILVAVYVIYYKRFRSGFTIGLLLFAALLLIQNILQVYFYTTAMEAYPSIVEQHVFVFGIVQLLAYAVILWVTLRN